MNDGNPIDHMRKCGAKRKRDGKPCQAPAMANGRCRVHGGKTPVGIGSVHWRNGRYSKALPADLARRFREAGADPDLLSLTNRLALTEARLVSVLGTLGEPGADWAKAKAAKEKLVAARGKQDLPGVLAALNELLAVIDAAAACEARWRTILELIEQQRRLIDSIHAREVKHAQVLSLAEAGALFNAMAATVRSAFVGLMAQLEDDGSKRAAKGALERIASEFQRVTSSGRGPWLQ